MYRGAENKAEAQKKRAALKRAEQQMQLMEERMARRFLEQGLQQERMQRQEDRLRAEMLRREERTERRLFEERMQAQIARQQLMQQIQALQRTVAEVQHRQVHPELSHTAEREMLLVSSAEQANLRKERDAALWTVPEQARARQPSTQASGGAML